MRRRSHVGGILLALFCLSLFSPPLYAQAEPGADSNKETIKKVEEHNRKGIEFYKAGQLPEAVQEMLEAYHLIPSNDLLYNI